MEETIFPERPDGKIEEEDSLLNPTSLGQTVCVHKSSTVGLKGIPLKDTL